MEFIPKAVQAMGDETIRAFRSPVLVTVILDGLSALEYRNLRSISVACGVPAPNVKYWVDFLLDHSLVENRPNNYRSYKLTAEGQKVRAWVLNFQI